MCQEANVCDAYVHASRQGMSVPDGQAGDVVRLAALHCQGEGGAGGHGHQHHHQQQEDQAGMSHILSRI